MPQKSSQVVSEQILTLHFRHQSFLANHLFNVAPKLQSCSKHQVMFLQPCPVPVWGWGPSSLYLKTREDPQGFHTVSSSGAKPTNRAINLIAFASTQLDTWSPMQAPNGPKGGPRMHPRCISQLHPSPMVYNPNWVNPQSSQPDRALPHCSSICSCLYVCCSPSAPVGFWQPFQNFNQKCILTIGRNSACKTRHTYQTSPLGHHSKHYFQHFPYHKCTSTATHRGLHPQAIIHPAAPCRQTYQQSWHWDHSISAVFTRSQKVPITLQLHT